ncbi:MucB/RseB C-terminal domain-containing protein [Ramlibacter sp. AN1133]|uniref:MucB/RseB C-terminal domain-containing protein n=1 Tax=Ramlibacter sp. AN1133 TaxID=3133429 RepID=UPI0030BFFB36
MTRDAPALVRRRLARGALALASGAFTLIVSQALAGPALPDPRPSDRHERSVTEWLSRMQEASLQRSYVGTFVVSSSNGAMASARIWHACDGQRQVERIDSLSGEKRSTFRRDDEVLTFLPESRTVRSERREALGLFPELAKADDSAIPEFYTARRVGSDRVAGFDADIVQVLPRDGLRFGYRIWSEKKSGLVIKLQTLDDQGHVLEQAAFSELQLDAPVRMDRLSHMMIVPEGWRVEKTDAVKTTAAAEGWTLRQQVAGFKSLNCYKRRAEGVLQWIFSDGLASVSLFVEDFDRERHLREGVFASGATHTLTRRVQEWWVTAVGEVPPATLKAFSLSLERRK